MCVRKLLVVVMLLKNVGNLNCCLFVVSLQFSGLMCVNQPRLRLVCINQPRECIYRDYFMVGECVRFLFTSCEGSLNERVSAANE